MQVFSFLNDTKSDPPSRRRQLHRGIWRLLAPPALCLLISGILPAQTTNQTTSPTPSASPTPPESPTQAEEAVIDNAPSTADAVTEDVGPTESKTDITILESPMEVTDPDTEKLPPAETAVLIEEKDEGGTEAAAEIEMGEGAGEGLGEAEADLIPLPEDAVNDLELLDLPMAPGPGEQLDDFVMPSDLPPMDTAPALPSVPVGEPARVLDARYKALRIKTDKDPELISLKQQADSATTFEQNRAALREYYRLLFKKMRTADKSLENRLNELEQAYLNRLAQSRLEPTIPLEPPPKPRPLE